MEKAIPTKVENLGIHSSPVLVVVEKTTGAVHGGHLGRHKNNTFVGKGAHMSTAFMEQVDMTTTENAANTIWNMQVESSLEAEQ